MYQNCQEIIKIHNKWKEDPKDQNLKKLIDFYKANYHKSH